MYAVIFRAVINQLDPEYESMVQEMRWLAAEKFGCIEITSAIEDDQEITISYWKSLDDINRWKQDERHLHAQKLGRQKWYQSYEVQVVEVLRSYKN